MTAKETARLQAGQVLTFPSQHTATEQFRDVIAAAGLEPPAEIHADGEIHRFSSNGKRGDFPRPLRIGRSAIGWPQSAVAQWIASRATTERR